MIVIFTFLIFELFLFYFVDAAPTDLFREHFEKYGSRIDDSVLMRDKHTRRPRRFGFITYADPSIVDKVMKDSHIILGKQVRLFPINL